MRRLRRLRLTALPALRETEMPNAVSGLLSAVSATTNSHQRPRSVLTPDGHDRQEIAAAAQAVFPGERMVVGLLGLVGDSEFMTSFGAAALEDVAAGFSGHPLAEAVVIFAFAV